MGKGPGADGKKAWGHRARGLLGRRPGDTGPGGCWGEGLGHGAREGASEEGRLAGGLVLPLDEVSFSAPWALVFGQWVSVHDGPRGREDSPWKSFHYDWGTDPNPRAHRKRCRPAGLGGALGPELSG